METQILSAILETGDVLQWGILYLIWNQRQIVRDLTDWKASTDKRLTRLETLQEVSE